MGKDRNPEDAVGMDSQKSSRPQRDRMLAGELYDASDPELSRDRKSVV